MSDKSCIDLFYDEIYDNLKSSKEGVKKEKFREVALAAESIPTSSLLDYVEATLKSVKDYCGVEVLSDCRFGERVREIDRRKRRMKDKIKHLLSILWDNCWYILLLVRIIEEYRIRDWIAGNS